MSKTPVKRPTPPKPAAKKPAPAAKKPAAKAPAKSAKPVAKPKPAAKPVAKPPVKAAPKPATKTSAKPAAKPAPLKPTPKPAAKTAPVKSAPAKPVAKAAPAPEPVKQAAVTKTAVPAPAPAPEAPAPKPVKVPQPKMSAAARASAAASTPAPVPPATSRFADRFAPPRPPARAVDPITLDVTKTAQKDPKLVNAWKSKAGRDLTEAEVLAMPDSEYMNEKQLEFFRTKLQTLKDDLLSNAGETTEHLREDTSIVPDPADRATIEEEHALELRTRDRERKLLKKISQSLARIDAGDYGFCDETGEPIGLGRLIARPTATLSLEAQQRRELKQKMFGD
ncbi:MAG: RNA polymerase-binding protein DksA [Rhizobacter sp.]|nr:RNA polymerase-binding protein DksA [Rhizobacter sp.]